MKKLLLAGFAAATLIQATGAFAADAAEFRAKAESRLQNVFGKRIQVAEASLIADGQILEVVLQGGPYIYMTPDASHLLYRDELIRIDGDQAVNVTEARQNPRRAEAMAKVADADTVLFKAKGDQKALINVFTDIDCGYCQKLHREVEELNELGITVRYLAYPRSGIIDQQTGQPTPSFQKINYVWCQAGDERQQAMTEMKTDQAKLNSLGRQMRAGQDGVADEVEELRQTLVSHMREGAGCETPVAGQFQLGQAVGVTGTPAIIAEDGQLFPGYMPAKDLAKALGI